MANKIVDLDTFRESRPVVPERQAMETNTVLTYSGLAVCTACGHEYEAVRVEHTTAIPCPECKTNRGHFMWPIDVPVGTQIFTCIHCTSQLFKLTMVGTFCVGCGAHHNFDGKPPPRSA